MRGSAALRTGVTPGGALAGPWVRDELWRRARAVPSLDLRFADSKTLRDSASGSELVTFTRASSGTYVGSDGRIKTAVTNLLLQSENFSTTWTSQLSSVTSDATTTPNGTVTADKIVASGGDGEHNTFQSFTVVSGQTYTFSCYLKAAERTSFSLAFRVASLWPSSLSQIIDFNLSNGTFAINGGSPTGTIVSVGNGWYRCSITSTAITSGTGQVRVQSVFNADGEGVFVWGAQLEQSTTVGEYIPTTSTINSAPRFDHNPTTGESLGLLVEEQRTNLLLRSEEFDNASWTKVLGSITANAATAPNGVLAADAFIPSTTAGLPYFQQNAAVTVGTVYTWSVFLKAAGYRWVFLDAFDGANRRSYFDLQTGTIGNVASGNTSVIDSFGNGWYRCTLTRSAGSANPAYAIAVATSNGGVAMTGDGTSGIYAWGAQLEAGSFPTSYIPTTSATVTRSADVASITGTNFSSWYRQDEGTVFSQFNSVTWNADTNFPKIFTIGTDDNNGFWVGGTPDDNQYRYRVRNGGVNQFGPANITRTPTLNNKIAMAIKAADFAVAADGVNLATVSSGTVPTANQMAIGLDIVGGNLANQPISRLTYWPTRLPNSTLQTITQ